MGKYGEIWGDMGRYGEVWGDVGMHGAPEDEHARAQVEVVVEAGGERAWLGLGLGSGLGLGLG